jgi:hypothetical protein
MSAPVAASAASDTLTTYIEINPRTITIEARRGTRTVVRCEVNLDTQDDTVSRITSFIKVLDEPTRVVFDSSTGISYALYTCMLIEDDPAASKCIVGKCEVRPLVLCTECTETLYHRHENTPERTLVMITAMHRTWQYDESKPCGCTACVELSLAALSVQG